MQLKVQVQIRVQVQVQTGAGGLMVHNSRAAGGTGDAALALCAFRAGLYLHDIGLWEALLRTTVCLWWVSV